MKKRGFTLIELLVVIAIIAMLLAILMPALNKVKKIAQRVVCGTNLKGLGTAQTVYANDYDDEYAVQGRGFVQTWNGLTGGWDNPAKVWADNQQISVGASLYLLVREADVSPKSFNCPAGAEQTFSGRNPSNLDIVQLWDFGNPNYTPPTGGAEGPAVCVSYSYHHPYGANGRKSTRAANGTLSAAFAVMADKSPYFDEKTTENQGGLATNEPTWMNAIARIAPYYTGTTYSKSSWQVKVANAHPHDRDGQNILFADGHASYENTPDVGVKNDNIYTIRGGGGTADVDQIRGGNHGTAASFNVAVGTARNLAVQPINGEDSFLVNDSAGGY